MKKITFENKEYLEQNKKKNSKFATYYRVLNPLGIYRFRDVKNREGLILVVNLCKDVESLKKTQVEKRLSELIKSTNIYDIIFSKGFIMLVYKGANVEIIKKRIEKLYMVITR